MQKNLDTLFAVEFGQLLENHLFGSSNRDEEKKIICSSLGLRSENQLAQIFAGYDMPTTASIFELIRTLNNPEFTERFFKLRVVNVGVPHELATLPETDRDLQTSDIESPLSGQEPCGNWEDSPAMCVDRLLAQNESFANRGDGDELFDEMPDLGSILDL